MTTIEQYKARAEWAEQSAHTRAQRCEELRATAERVEGENKKLRDALEAIRDGREHGTYMEPQTIARESLASVSEIGHRERLEHRRSQDQRPDRPGNSPLTDASLPAPLPAPPPETTK